MTDSVSSAGSVPARDFVAAERHEDVLEQSESGREIARKYLEQGLEKGLERGLEQGEERGRIRGMRALRQAKYGDLDDLDELARRLAGRDHDANVARIVAGATVAELRA